MSTRLAFSPAHLIFRIGISLAAALFGIASESYSIHVYIPFIADARPPSAQVSAPPVPAPAPALSPTYSPIVPPGAILDPSPTQAVPTQEAR